MTNSNEVWIVAEKIKPCYFYHYAACPADTDIMADCECDEICNLRIEEHEKQKNQWRRLGK